MNCQTYGRDCVYEPVPEVAKEAGREQHLRRRKASTSIRGHAASSFLAHEDTGSPLGIGGDTSSVCHDDGDDIDKDQPWASAASSREMETGVARVVVSANGVSSYHGRTSALFEDGTQDRSAVAAQHRQMSDQWVERGLVAEAAKQRE